MSNRVAHFEIHADNPERAIEFYTKIFGWEIKKWEGGQMEYWMIMTAPKEDTTTGINGGLVRRHGPSPADGQSSNAYVCTIIVSSYDEYAVKIEANGGKNVMPKFAIAGMAWQGYFQDTEGNTFGLHQADMKAV